MVPSELLEWQIRILFLFSGDNWLKISKHLFLDEVKINPRSCLCFVSISSIFLIAFCSSANELRVDGVAKEWAEITDRIGKDRLREAYANVVKLEDNEG